ncbi:MAG: 3-hydroxyacyl-CoA dehydrogenase [Rhodospirillaceae bacterium]|jgi:NAD(P)-dependent dehydrogenase (short-subunit alcohol dehydrogenase family)|nr:3-hydroxyacyl-CoA dehydrogenase [Rhodospirillaceae bacterium]MBT4491318.1 3-hydroxyacyl-CoA dehydrogenase [Rhodospirillaceae bacterium]MBT5195788.1 3-hydroxyacyl-CoA dehydrogenase [Rhodospirillaceae bacterium]MBT5898478.1 3-hydroxyacyl-CoA dehydrogenase [Rhodospirillaceae bacterium]MBT6427771.1 3-hydroxyacyl-CoA dehydrogenase [Rhodospirillaceae bacterium]
MQVDGQVAIITGGASGLGEGTARELAGAGAKVAIWDIQEDKGMAIAKEIGGVFCKCDVTSEDGVIAAIGETREALGTARILVNCAGTGVAVKTTSRGEAHPLDQFERIIKINLIGTFNCIRLVSTDMVGLDPLDHGERGVVINTASVAAYDGQIGQAAYSASKGGIVGMTLPVARDLADKGIRVCTIAPGIFETPLLGTLPDDVRQSLANSVPFPQKLGQPGEYAQLARQIVENVMLNGETIRLDGAIRMAPR